MPKPQARIGRDGKLFYDRLEIFNYVCDVEEKMKAKGIKTNYYLRKAIDDSFVYYINGKKIAQDHPGVPEIEGEAGDVPRDYFSATHNLNVKAPRKKKSRPKHWVRSKCNTHWIKSKGTESDTI